MKALLLNDLSFSTPPYALRPPIKVHETRSSHIFLDRTNFETGKVLSWLRTEGNLTEIFDGSGCTNKRSNNEEVKAHSMCKKPTPVPFRMPVHVTPQRRPQVRPYCQQDQGAHGQHADALPRASTSSGF